MTSQRSGAKHADDITFSDTLRKFADGVKRRTTARAAGEPEEQLRGPIADFFEELRSIAGHSVVVKGESRLPARLGQPDFAVLVDGLIVGYVELKKPGTGANTGRFGGRDKEQWTRFSALPNILYTDGNEWGLYRSGERVGRLARISGDITRTGKAAVSDRDAGAVLPIVTDFLAWQPIVPSDAPELARVLAPLCLLLRNEVQEALSRPKSPLVKLANEWRGLLFPDATDEQFADAYAQTVTFALLLARAEGAKTLVIDEAVRKLGSSHGLLSRALQVLTDPQALDEIASAVEVLQRAINAVDQKALLGGADDPWIYFYEEFLATYDARLRRDAGVYYTPVEVVKAQVALIQHLLTKRLKQPLGFAEESVVTLDPGVGTGTYLLGIIDRSLADVELVEGKGAVKERANVLAKNLHGFEWMVGPYSVAELRVTQAIRRRGGRTPREGVNVFLTNTLASPNAHPPKPGLFYQPISVQQERALQIKEKIPVLVCLGNPPYDRHAGDAKAKSERKGGWVVLGDHGPEGAILQDFIAPAKKAGQGVHLKNLYNLYVYFWRWAIWKVFEHKTARGPGVVSFISASSYLTGDAFVGMREHLRRQCDEIWVIDLGGEGRGARKEENVFAIQTPVVIALAARYGSPHPDKPAAVHYTRLRGSRSEKLRSLAAIQSFKDLEWVDCSTDWQATFSAVETDAYSAWPAISDLFPWQHTGMQFKRLWPIAPDRATLERRWEAFLRASSRAAAFRSTRDRNVNMECTSLTGDRRLAPLGQLPSTEPVPSLSRIGQRSFDFQWAIADSRVGDFLKPVLWQAHGPTQIYLATQLSFPLGNGPAITVSHEVPDLHFFSGRGGKDIIPLWRDSTGNSPNIAPGLLDAVGGALETSVTPEDFAAYCYGVLACPEFTSRFSEELERAQVRVPITRDPDKFRRAREIGRRLLWLHTYANRFRPPSAPDSVPQGAARCVKTISSSRDSYPADFRYDEDMSTIAVGDGAIAPVSKGIWDFEVSGLKVIRSWLSYRIRTPDDAEKSILDKIRPESWTATMTRELLELLWVLELTTAGYDSQGSLLREIVAGPLLSVADLPAVPDSSREAPQTRRAGQQIGMGLD